DQRIGDDGVGSALLVGHLRLPHAVADYLAAAELHFLAIGREIFLDLDDQIGVGEPHLVAGGRAEHVGIDGTLDFHGHDCAPPADSFPPPLRGRGREGGAACGAARLIAVTTPSRLFNTSSLAKRSTRYPREANHRSRRSSCRTRSKKSWLSPSISIMSLQEGATKSAM